MFKKQKWKLNLWVITMHGKVYRIKIVEKIFISKCITSEPFPG